MIKLNEKTRIIKNVLAASISFLFIFSAVNSAASVQPVLNQDGNLGLASQTTLYAVEILTALVIPAIVCEQFGFKWSLFIGELCFLTYIAAQAYPKWETLIPTSIIAGFGNSLCWYVIGVYITLLSKSYSELNSVPFAEILTYFFGINGCIFMLSYFVGNAQIALILETNEINLAEATRNTTYDYGGSCGSSNCPDTKFDTESVQYKIESVYGLCGALDILMILSMITTIFFMDDIKVNDKNEKIEHKKLSSKIFESFINEFSALFKLYQRIDVWLLFPITLYTGFELTFIWFEFSRAFAHCLKGLNYVGWANIFFGLLASLLSFLMGIVLKYIGKPAGIVLMLCTSFTQCVFMISWTAKPDYYYVIFFMIIGFSISQSVAQAQVRGLYGIYFPGQQAAFSAATLAQTIGLFLGALFSTFLCAAPKIYTFAGIILASMICYIIMIIKHSKISKVGNTTKAECDLEKMESNYTKKDDEISEL